VSLDVYLRIPGAPPRVSSGIFVRENGATHELTRDEWDLRYPGREPAVANITDCESDTSVLDANITHNLGTCGSKYPHEAHEWQQMEPVIWRGGRKRDRTEDTVRDWVSANITLKKGLSGAKPPAFCDWVFDLLGATDDDTLDDLFPGTGVVTARWNARQYDLSERAPVYEHPEWPDGFGGAQ
jgi:hypothetical protein